MKEITTIGLDIANNAFQVHGVNEEGAVVVRRQLRRSQVLPFFPEAVALSHRYRGVCYGAPLGA